MFDLANLSLDIIILLLRVAVVFLLYFFLWQVLRSIVQSVGASAAGSSASPYGQLIVVRSGQSGVATGKAFPLGPSTIIGRSMDQCEIALNDSFLSAQHARLELRGDEWVLEDLNSTNGTFVNDVEVRDAALVEDGDIIRIGRVEMKLATRV